MSTFMIPDPYEGWSIDQLKARCRKLVGAGMQKDRIIASMTLEIPGGVDALPEAYREEVRRIRAMLED